MKYYTPSKSSLFLLELIIAILFFTLCSAVCVQLFAKSHTLTESARDLKDAVLYAQNIVEQLDAYDGNPKDLAAEGSPVLLNSEFQADITLHTDNRPYTGTVAIYDLSGKNLIYSLEFAVSHAGTPEDF